MLDAKCVISLPKDLPVDACIIDEQNEHLVIAVRLAKSTIRDNHALMAALSERSDDGGITSRIAAPIRMAVQPVLRKYAVRLAACAFAATVAVPAAIGWPWESAMPPVEMFGKPEIRPIVPLGGQIVVSGLFRRNKLCPQEVQWEITRPRSHEAVFLTRHPVGVAVVSKEPIARDIKDDLPIGIKPGDYEYTRTLYNLCGGAPIPLVVAFRLPFKVVE